MLNAHSPLLVVDHDGLAWITFSDPGRKLNVLDQAVMHRLDSQLTEISERAASGEVKALIFWSGKPDSFIAGADIEAIGQIESPADGEAKARLGQRVFGKVEALSIPTLAAVNGICLGGGVELALACRFRVASSDEKTRFALPEVQLGLLPGWGGSTRLPRLIGLRPALDIILTGKQVRPDKAKRIGLVSEVLPAESFRRSAREFALAMLTMEPGASRRKPGWSDKLLEGSAFGRRVVLNMARKQVMKTTGGHYPAPLRIVRLLKEALGRPVEEALVMEAAAFGELSGTSIHRNLLHLFGLREQSKKPHASFAGASPRPVDVLGVIGAGVMGGGVAQIAAHNGIRVRMKDIRDEAITGGLQHARSLFQKQVSRRRLTRRQADQKMEQISGSLDYQGFRALDLVVEAVVERMDVKRAVLKETEGQVRDDCVLATNTSSLSVVEMGAELEHPERFCGLHFFNPVHRMPLVEIIRGEHTDAATLATVHALALKLGKVPVVCADGAGFLVNRILGPYLNEAGFMIAEGVPIEDIDRVAVAFGMPMGPVRLLDEVGIDIARHAGKTLHDAFGARMAPAPCLTALESTERLGRKNGKGFYRWEDDKESGVDETVFIDLGLQSPVPAKLDEDTIRLRLILAMINEAARVLEDGIVQQAGAVDLGMIMGTGFPPFRGGLLRFADERHPKALVDDLRGLEQTHGQRFSPAPVLLELAERDRTFYEAFPSP